MSIYLSTLTENDYETSLTMIQEAYEDSAMSSDYMVQLIKRLRYASNYRYELEVIVKTTNGEVIGHAICAEITIHNDEMDYNELVLESVAVAKSYRAKGVGKALVQALEERALSEDYTAIVVFGEGDYFQSLGYEKAIDHDIHTTFDVSENNFRVKFLWDALENWPHGVIEPTE